MARLYVTEQGAGVGLDRGKIRVMLGEQLLSSTPANCIEAISLFGNVGITTPLLHHCFKADCRVAFFSRSGRYLGSALLPSGKNIPLRIAQVKFMEDNSFSMQIASTIVETKIRNCRRFTKRQLWNSHNIPVDSELAVLTKLARACQTCNCPKALRSLEARAARIYFGVLGQLVASRTEFVGRIRRPPQGILNVLLSLGYSMLSAECASAIEAAGLDPCIGVMHSLRYGRASLGLDLVEEFRTPVAERLAINLITNNFKDFREGDEPATLLSKRSLDRFFREYEKRMTTSVTERDRRLTLRQAIHRQAGRLANCFRTGTPEYIPFLYR